MEKESKKTNKIIVNAVYQELRKEFKPLVGATPGRKRPRNPQKRETLLRWQEERGGKKIGEI